jgi:hypothetical protein
MSFTIRKEEGMSGLNKLCEDIRMFPLDFISCWLFGRAVLLTLLILAKTQLMEFKEVEWLSGMMP